MNEIHETEYPFGFGFELMGNPAAMAYFDELNEKEKKDVMRQVKRLKSGEELRRFLDELAQGKKHSSFFKE